MKHIFKGKLFSRIGRRNLLILSLVLLLGVAVFVNYRWFYQPVSDQADQVSADADGAGDKVTEADYFSAAEISRDQTRDKALDALQAAVTSLDESVDKAGSLAQINRIALDMENESNIEALIKAKGFEKCVAVINGDSASVIVSSAETELLPTQVAQISAIVYEQTGILPSHLTIIRK